MCSLSYSTYKPEVPLASDLSTRSEQKLMEESGGVYCSLCNVFHGVYSQTMSRGKDMYKFNNTSLHQEKYQKYEDIYDYLYVEPFICMYMTRTFQIYTHFPVYQVTTALKKQGICIFNICEVTIIS